MSRDDRVGLAFLGLHPDRARAEVERHGSAGSVLRLAARAQLAGVDPHRVVSPAARVEVMERAGCRPVLLGDPEYPAALAELGDPPDVLFVRGSLPLSPGVAVVGTRRCTAYGRRLATAFGRSIAGAGWPLVSGLARGIDGAAHRGTVEASGVGVAVLGSGSDVLYPRDHRELHDELLAAGAVITEYPPGTRPDGWRFPPRNRIISGLSAAVVVVEAAVTGGALVTAMRAGEQGRALFAVPGDVDREASVGCNLLIRDGAIPVLGADDLIEALSLVLGPPRPMTPGTPADSVTGVDALVLAAAGDPVTADRLAEMVGLPVSDVLGSIARLELAGHVVTGDGVVTAA